MRLPFDLPTPLLIDLTDEDRSALVARLRQEAITVADVGFWSAPKGWFVYWAVNQVNWKIYIGMTNNFVGRTADHRNEARNGSLLPLHCALRKYGESNFVFVPIEQFDDEAATAAAERKAIAIYHTQDRDIGYNIADGGVGLGSRGAREIHARPEFRARFLATRFERASKAAETRRRNQAMREAELAGLTTQADD